jgi:hypothetical protein
LNLAGEILRRSIGSPDQQRMLDTFVADIEQAPATAANRNGNGSNGKEQAPPNAGREPAPPDAEGIT